MNNIVSPSVLNIAALAVPWLALFLHYVFLRQKRLLVSALLGTIAMYALLLWSVNALNAEIDAKLNSFDLNHDGGFTEDEMTPAYREAMADYQNDTGRAMAPVTGAIFSFVYGTLAFGLWSLCSNVFEKSRANRI